VRSKYNLSYLCFERRVNFQSTIFFFFVGSLVFGEEVVGYLVEGFWVGSKVVGSWVVGFTVGLAVVGVMVVGGVGLLVGFGTYPENKLSNSFPHDVIHKNNPYTLS
jgi:hypothetical protein